MKKTFLKTCKTTLRNVSAKIRFGDKIKKNGHDLNTLFLKGPMAHGPESVAVFCGGSPGNDPIFMEKAYAFGKILADNKITLVYGGGGTGVMRAVADGCCCNGGNVIGITIQSLWAIERPDLVVKNIHRFEVRKRMSDRKVSMTKQSDAICVFPGGIGTLDELFEILALRQLHIIEKPLIVVNTNGFYDTLKQMLKEMADKQFIKPHQLELMTFVEDIDDILPTIAAQMRENAKKAKEAGIL